MNNVKDHNFCSIRIMLYKSQHELLGLIPRKEYY